MIDFTGWACVNCRRMEEKVWPDPLVDSLMRTQFVVVSLYVDERKKLPLADQTVYKLASGVEKSIITVGDKWSTFQTENFGATSQPQYAIISADEKALTKTKFYTPMMPSNLPNGFNVDSTLLIIRIKNNPEFNVWLGINKNTPRQVTGLLNLVSFCNSLLPGKQWKNSF